MIGRFDIAIIGAGMAGASLAAQIGTRASAVILEAEDTPGYHATGRSAAFWTESYGGPQIQPLTTASGPFLREQGFLAPRSALTIGRSDQADEVDAFVERFRALGVTVERMGRCDIENRIPGLRPGWTCGALEPDCCDIDVAALHRHYLASAHDNGIELRLRSRVSSAAREGDGWRIALDNGAEVRCAVIVNAAGAWADRVAQAAGVRALGILPRRRTVAQLAVSPTAPADLPLCLDIAEKFYFKPETGRIWLSPHDETPSEPCDAAPEELDIALAIDRFEQVVDWTVKRVEHRWAGLRSFAPDRLPVYGYDARVPGFFWFAGQGGFGIQTAPAAAALGAGLLLGDAAGPVDPKPFAADRFG